MPESPAFRGQLWPTPTELQLMRAALLPDERAVDAWVGANGFSDQPWGRLWEIIPLAFYNLQQQGYPMSEMAEAAGTFTQAVQANEILLGEAASLLTRLDEARIQTMVLKGAALLHTAYPHPGTRPMWDVDILVPFANARQAIEVVKAAGFSSPIPVSDAMLDTHAGAQFVNASGVDVDLHWHALASYLADSIDELFWDGATSVELRGAPTQLLGPAEQVCHVMAHGVRGSMPQLRRLTDVALLLRSTDLDGARLARVADELGIALSLRDALTYLGEQVGVQVPADLVVLLDEASGRRDSAWRHSLQSRLKPESFPSAVLRGWNAYSTTRRAQRRRAGPFGFVKFMWRYLASKPDVSHPLAALGRRLRRS